MIQRILPEDHPAARGHFPGNPIIPGAVLLSEALAALEGELGGAGALVQVRSAKFLRPARPGDCMLVSYERNAQGDIRFTCAVGGKPVLTGQVSCGGPSTEG